MDMGSGDSVRRSIVRLVRSTRILVTVAPIPAYVLLAPRIPYALLPFLFAVTFIASQFIDLRHPYHPWLGYLSPISGFLLNASVIFNTGFQRSPFLFLLLVPIVTYGIERHPVWALRSAIVNTLILAFLGLRALIEMDWFGVSYVLGLTMTSYTACHLIRETQGLLASHAATLEEEASKDPLTGLYNRRAFVEYVAELCSRQAPFGLIMCDLDDFKCFNDRYGHLAGDEALRKVGELLRESLRPTDAAFRYGGDEFAIIIPEADESAAGTICDRIERRVLREIGGVGISFGSAFFPKDGDNVEKVIGVADKELYEAKSKLPFHQIHPRRKPDAGKEL